MSELAMRILDYRAKYNLSMEKMAEVCGVTMQTIFNIEKGLTNATSLTTRKIENGLRILDNEN